MDGPALDHITEGTTTTLPKAWSDALTEFTANQIPIRLIDLRTLRLVSRSDVARYYRPILAEYLQKHSSRYKVAMQCDIRRTIFKFIKYAMFSHRWLAEGEPTFGDMSMVRTFAEVLIRDDEVCILYPRVLHAHTHPRLFCGCVARFECLRSQSRKILPPTSRTSPPALDSTNYSCSAPRHARITVALPGPTLVASTKTAAPNLTNPSVPCLDGTTTPSSASSTSHPPLSWMISLQTSGSHGDGLSKSCLRRKI